ncbi:hypothetical protein ACFV5G_13410 [Streptomyces sp. NPDC059766]|uniref:hypothetical protein n=1 Tax=Streptomyces sp. NPDC059766 TaxID=3346940 RepID=UPI003657609F
MHEQIHSNTHMPARLKHRKAGEFREVPLPRSLREAMERHEEKHGTTKDGCLPRGPSGSFMGPGSVVLSVGPTRPVWAVVPVPAGVVCHHSMARPSTVVPG